MVGYNLTNIATNSSSGVVGLVQGVNVELMGGWLGVLILVSVAAVLFINYMFFTNDLMKSASATAFISFGFSLFLVALKLIGPVAFFITLILCGLIVAATGKTSSF